MLITLTTDFGYRDPFVGIMKGVIAGINPNARVIDLSHDIPPQDIMAGALVLRHSVPYFARGTIHVAVIDPGVGGARRPLLLECDGNYFVGPDNGVLSLALEGQQPQRIIHLSNSTYHLQPVCATFHGRDIFAPVAAYLSLGVAAVAFGDSVESFVRLKLPEPERVPRRICGEILYIDSFGNLFTNISEHDLTGLTADKLVISLRDAMICGLASHYAAPVDGEFVALINSWGLLEIAVYNGSAERRATAKVGDKVTLSSAESKAGGLAMSERLSWDQYFMTITQQVAERSTCTRAKVGAVIVRDKSILATGYNGAPAGMPHCTDVGCLIYESKTPNGDTEQNCFRTIHAEMNAIAQAAKNGSSIKEAAIYITHTPCIHCLKVLVNTGIKDIYYQKPYKLNTLDELLSYTQVQLYKVDLPGN